MVQSGGVAFELRQLDNGKLVHVYVSEGAALAFLRDVLRVGGREQAAGFTLEQRDDQGGNHVVASGPALLQRAIEDRAE